MNKLIAFGVIGILAGSSQYSGSGDSEVMDTTENRGCFSYTFTTVEDLRKKLKSDDSLQAYIRQHVIKKMEMSGESGEQPCLENSGTTSGTDEISATKPIETTTHEISEAATELPATTTHSISVSQVTETRSTETTEDKDCETTGSSQTFPVVTTNSNVPENPKCLAFDFNMTNWNSSNDTCFYILENWDGRATYKEAIANCSKLGGRLAAKGTTYLSSNGSYFKNCIYQRFWIGLEKSENDWKWSDNIAENVDWAIKHPKPDQQCALLKRKTQTSWHIRSHNCTEKRRYICEKYTE